MTEKEIVGRYVEREDILSGALDEFVIEAGGAVRLTPVEERLAIKREMLAEIPPDEDAWLFGYGSLIWNPAFSYAERQVGLVRGYRRNFSFWSTVGRGSAELPGLMLALEPGGSCHGVAYRVKRADAARELRSVFMREMMTESYMSRWVNVRCGDRTVRAITFVANPTHPNYAGVLPLETVASHIAGAEGRLGRCSDYLVNTVRHLRGLGIDDRNMTRLLALVEEISHAED